ncbi:putative membrane protein [Propionispora sp. 2/2-37]|uniref:PTS transporter subunit EIIC n=1 Tax=Propionispora sp. 2/2-37 TaxID=1677858 RepID=UPI0006BB7720|nr:PTS transporter subunit EIIC [Propionispora sp. 2/2-37]CUH94947.1 putative membrane protein [Propionispora sp. 2/2-37]
MKNAFRYFQQIGQSLMLPVSVLPAAGLLFRFGEKDLLDMPALREAGMAVFTNLPLIFAVGVAIGLSGGKSVAALAAVVGHLIFLAVLQSINPEMNMGVFSGITMGIVAAVAYRQYHEIKLPQVLGFFSGKRFVPIVTSIAGVFIAFLLQLIWPVFQNAIDTVGHLAVNSSFGPAFFAAGKRLLIPIGLHHVYYPAFLYEFGHFTTIDGTVIRGDFNRYYAGDPAAGMFMASEFPIMMFGLPAAAFAIFYNALPERRKAVGGLMASAALTSFLTGITEPVEFTFIFLAPALFIFHVLMAGISGLITSWLDIHLGFTFSASFIDYVLSYHYGHHQLWLWPVGLGIGILYFAVFHFAINYFQLKTPGREEAFLSEQAVPHSRLADKVLEALGGAGNIEALDACVSRLRVSVRKRELVKKRELSYLGAVGIMEMGDNFQLVFGTQSDLLKEEIADLLGNVIAGREEHIAQDAPPVEQYIRIKAPVSGRIFRESECPAANGNHVAIATGDRYCLAPVVGRITESDSENRFLTMMINDSYRIKIRVDKAKGKPMMVADKGQVVCPGEPLMSLPHPETGELIIIDLVVIGNGEIEITPAEEVTAGEDVIIQIAEK